MVNKGVLFNSACSYPPHDFDMYTWLKDFKVFTFEEVKLIWEFMDHNDQIVFLSQYGIHCRGIIREFLEGDIDVPKKIIVCTHSRGQN